VTPERDGSGHVDAGELSAYVEQRLDSTARALVEAHLADCAACRADALAALRAGRGAPSTWRWIAPALAAGIAVVLLVPRFFRQTPPDTERAGRAPAVVALVSPASDAALAPDSVRLVWHAVPGGADYRVTVTTETGELGLRLSTRDTMFAVPADALAPGTRYLWTVDAVAVDGAALTSHARGFAIRR